MRLALADAKGSRGTGGMREVINLCYTRESWENWAGPRKDDAVIEGGTGALGSG